MSQEPCLRGRYSNLGCPEDIAKDINGSVLQCPILILPPISIVGLSWYLREETSGRKIKLISKSFPRFSKIQDRAEMHNQSEELSYLLGPYLKAQETEEQAEFSSI